MEEYAHSQGRGTQEEDKSKTIHNRENICSFRNLPEGYLLHQETHMAQSRCLLQVYVSQICPMHCANIRNATILNHLLSLTP